MHTIYTASTCESSYAATVPSPDPDPGINPNPLSSLVQPLYYFIQYLLIVGTGFTSAPTCTPVTLT